MRRPKEQLGPTEPRSSIEELARGVLVRPDLESKLRPWPSDLAPGEPVAPVRIEGPARSAELAIRSDGTVRVPPVQAMADPHQRVRILHALANHELQATELFAWALLLFSDQPSSFRAGLVRILREEQEHTRLYAERLRAYDCELGSFPVNGYFWGKTPGIRTPIDFVTAMSLTFENANLDHTIELATAFERVGDSETALVVRRIHEDEIGHVRFGWTWLRRLASGEDPWTAYSEALTWPLRGAKASGHRFHREPRLRAGLSADFVERLHRSRESADRIDARTARKERAARRGRLRSTASAEEG